MRRFSFLFALMLVLVGGISVASQAAQAQDDSLATEGHVLVGAWLADTDTEDSNAFDATFLFHDDGTYIEIDASDGDTAGTSSVGVWAPTGERTADLTIVQVISNPDETNFQFVIRASIEVAEDGQSFTAQYTFEVVGVPGAEGQYGPGTATGTRISVEPVGTPIGPLDDVFAQFEDSGTPEATPAAA